MDIIRKPYEISLWEDILTFVYEDGFESEGEIVNEHGAVIAQYYKEQKLCIIGSNTMDTPIRATQGKLISKVNGENILTFNMYSHYYDNDLEEYFVNPFIKLLINERKIKLRYGEAGKEDTEWYDLIIKNIQENSETKTYTYTAKNMFVNELSKSGFNIEFHQDLENNTGNIEYLAEIVLAESDWKLKKTGKVLKQTIEEPLYYAEINRPITLVNMEDDADSVSLASGELVYIFYNSIVNKLPYVQLLYAENYEIDDDSIITNSPNWYLDNVSYNENDMPDFVSSLVISDEYRGRRLVRKAKTKYDATIDKYVNVYLDDSNSEIYGYSETKYTSPALVRSYITNPNSYDSSVGWSTGCGISGSFPAFDLVTVPDVRDVPAEEVLNGSKEFKSCLKLTFTEAGQALYNSGVVDLRHHIDGFVQGEKYIFRIKCGKDSGVYPIENAHGAYSLAGIDSSLTLKVGLYSLQDGRYVFTEDPLFQFTFDPQGSNLEPDYLVSEPVECRKTITYAEMIKMTNTLGFFIQSDSINEPIYIEDVQFFPYINKGQGAPLLPEEIQVGEVYNIYYYYKPNDNYKSLDEVEYIYRGTERLARFREAYNDSEYEKIRSITVSESNRFNLIQELCETFECWPKFEIEHNQETGEILLDENYRQKKWISFHEYIDQDNYSGFKYGINLKSIQRSVDSEGVVSKLIVKNNSNEFAQNGFCTIARASENPSGENFILDFSYYIQQGMMGLPEVTNDLYFDPNNSQGYLGYYKELKRINSKRDLYIEEQGGLVADLSEYEASLQSYELSVAEANKLYADKLSYIKSLTGYTFQQLMLDQENEWWGNEQVITTISSIGRLKSVIANHQKIVDKATENLTRAQNRYDRINRILTATDSIQGKKLLELEDFEENHVGENITVILESGEEVEGVIQLDGTVRTSDGERWENIYYIENKYYQNEERLYLEKIALNNRFYKKYSRFLQEGSWISEDHLDDNLYYLDAQSTLTTSAKPKVTYNIAVLEISQLEGYENFTFALGDKTTIEDTEFFGWVWRDSIQTPYQEEIVVTELTIMLDSPEQNQIKVQNYKTQFEDLFQRMAAATQSIEYSSGKYQKVSGILETDGTINITTLQNSIANNALTLQNAKDQSVIWDETGITTTSVNNPAEVVRIVSGGIFLSTDGGIAWNTGITGRGINANYITSGQLNVEEVNILNGAFPSFRWDKTGISAYEFTLNKHTNLPENFNYSRFIRLDQYGLYGINGYPNFDPMRADDSGIVGEEKIWANANFALTWSGFQIRSKRRGLEGYIKITETDDIQLINRVEIDGTLIDIDQVKIGLLDQKTGEAIYGLRLKNNLGQVVLEQSSQGRVWIRDELKIGTADTSTVSLGYLKKYRNDETAIKDDNGEIVGGISQVIHAGEAGSPNEFAVYEDGRLEATGGYFKGEIHADYGTIGGVNISSILSDTFEVEIEVSSGVIFRGEAEEKKLTAILYENGKQVSEDRITSYTWYLNGVKFGENSKFAYIKASDFENSADCTCEIDFD